MVKEIFANHSTLIFIPWSTPTEKHKNGILPANEDTRKAIVIHSVPIAETGLHPKRFTTGDRDGPKK